MPQYTTHILEIIHVEKSDNFLKIARNELQKFNKTSGYATMVHGRGVNPHRPTTTFAKPEMTSLMMS